MVDASAFGGALLGVDIAIYEALFDEYRAASAGKCQ